MKPRAQPKHIEIVRAPPPPARESDYYTWCFAQAALLDAGKFGEIEPLDIADEISDIAWARYEELKEALTSLLTLALLFDHGRRSGRVLDGFDSARHDIRDMIAAAPSLGARAAEATRESFKFAKYRAMDELDVDEDQLPASCPWAFDEIMARDFFASAGTA